MFELMSGGGAGRGRRAAWPVIVSTIAHAAALTAVAVLPLLYATDHLPEVPAMMAFVATPPPPPPPPPPPAPRAASAAAAARSAPATGAFAAPVEAPSRIEPEAGIDRGFEGGVPGGVEGGVPGGVVGGIVGGLVSEVPPPPPPPPAPRLVRVGGAVQQPALVLQPSPAYPELAVRARVQGTVILEAIVDEDGRVRDVRLLRSIPLLDEAALMAVRGWRYAPLLLNGVPQPFILTVTVSFRIPENASAAR